MIREVDLISYLPQFVQEYREIKEIMANEEPEIQVLEDETEIIKNNQFILSCDEIGIERFESFLGIAVEKNDILETRIKRVLVRWNDSTPYTRKWLEQALKTFYPGNNFHVEADNDNYALYVYILNDYTNFIEELKSYLREKVPANLTLYPGTQNETEPLSINISSIIMPSISTTALPYLNLSYEFRKKVIINLSSTTISETIVSEI